MRILTIAVMCYCLGITTETSHLRASVRNVRKDRQSVLSLCVETGKNGPQTLIVEGPEEESQQVIKLMADFATLGVCDLKSHHVAPLNKRRKKMVKVCLKSEGERITIRLPRVTRREFKKIGATSGSCKAPSSRIEINLVGDDIKDTSSSADISGKWRAQKVKIGNSLSLETPLKGSPITMQFSETGFSASAGCNKIFGGFLIESTLDDSSGRIIHQVEISRLASTRKLCYPRTIMNQERAFIKLMALKTFSYEINADDQLEFHEMNELDGMVSEDEAAVFERIGSSNI